MNLKKQFLLISLIQLTWACDSGNSIHYQPALLQLEDSLEQTPQKTLHALWLMDTTAFRPEDRQLYHYIAYKGAMLLPDEKNPKPEELKASIGYFREKGDSARLYQLYYYLGQVYTGHFAWLRASNSFAEARKYAGQNPRRVFQAKLGEAYVYRFKMMYKEEETCLEQALQIARSLSDRNLKDRARYELSVLYLHQKRYADANRVLSQVVSRPEGEQPALFRASCFRELGRSFLRMGQPDSALVCLGEALCLDNSRGQRQECSVLRGESFLRLHRFDEAEETLMDSINLQDHKHKAAVYRTMSQLMQEKGDFKRASYYLEQSLLYRDSLDYDNHEEYMGNLNAFQEHDRQQRELAQAEEAYTRRTSRFNQAINVFGLFVLVALLLFIRTYRKKKKIQEQLYEEHNSRLDLMARQQAAELKLLQEKKEKEAMEIEKLNQSINFYKRLNTLTIPILMKTQNAQGAIHLEEEEWDIIVKNTDACFDGFTTRLKKRFPDLTLDEIRFACLLKMEFSIHMLSNIYHIAKPSISRKKMRLKEKMGIEDMNLDDFIQQF